jgi:hypothetical protein
MLRERVRAAIGLTGATARRKSVDEMLLLTFA